MHDVVIVGGGPVGLYLGALLLQNGLDVRVLERRAERSTHSRAIGIHPPALAALADVQVSTAMVAEGVQISDGLARSGGRTVAGLSFADSSPAIPFVLTIPQVRTEALLEERVRQLDPQALVRGAEVTAMHDDGLLVTLRASTAGRTETYQAALVIGADGARSTVRGALGVRVRARDYPDSYLMGDFVDGSADGPLAVLYLEPGGIVESFPLPGGLRRWVVHTDQLLTEAVVQDLAALIRARTGAVVNAGSNSMLSAFSVRARLAERMVSGRTALIGDAAHEISPIGGQGMNLGWLDAAALAPIITGALRGNGPGDFSGDGTGGGTGRLLAGFERERKRAAARAVRQSELNMTLGRPLSPGMLKARNTVVGRAFDAAWVRNAVARRFTMQ